MAAGSRISIVTFNGNEKAAVDQMFDDLRGGGWTNATHSDPTVITRPPLSGTVDIRLSHVHRAAQGNVMVSTELARLFAGATGSGPDYVVFYGCAGTLRTADVGNVYLVAEARYLGLGTVQATPGGERVTLKNKWIEAAVLPHTVTPIPARPFPLVRGGATRDLLAETKFPPARVIGTEAVVHVLPDATPPPEIPGTSDHWADGEWTYGQAMAHVTQGWAGMDVLVQMESYGIAATTRALNLGDQVVVLRIATDDLVGKKNRPIGGGQGPLLMQGRIALMQLIAALLELP